MDFCLTAYSLLLMFEQYSLRGSYLQSLDSFIERLHLFDNGRYFMLVGWDLLQLGRKRGSDK